MNRRRFLKRTFSSIPSWTLLQQGFRAKPAFAENTAPKRLLLIHSHHGAYYPNWTMRPTFNEEDWSSPLSSLNWSPMLSPFEDLASKMLVLDGCSMVSAELDNVGTRHEVGQIHMGTGSWTQRRENAILSTAPSFEQIIGRSLVQEGQYTALTLAVGQPFNTISWSAAGIPEPFNRQFSNHQALNLDAKAQAALMNSVIQDFDQHSFAASQLLQTHQHHLQSIQKRQQLADFQNCLLPVLSQNLSYWEDFANVMDFVIEAFRCQISPVISVNLGQIPLQYLQDGQYQDIHLLAHQIYQNPEANDIMTLYYQQQSQAIAELLWWLNETPESNSDFGTLLENTVVLCLSELAEPNHSFVNMPIVLAGGDNFANLNLGNYLHLARRSPLDGIAWNSLRQMGTPHQKCLNSIAQVFNIFDSIGLEGVTTTLGDRIDCSGVIDGLFA